MCHAEVRLFEFSVKIDVNLVKCALALNSGAISHESSTLDRQADIGWYRETGASGSHKPEPWMHRTPVQLWINICESMFVKIYLHFA